MPLSLFEIFLHVHHLQRQGVLDEHLHPLVKGQRLMQLPSPYRIIWMLPYKALAIIDNAGELAISRGLFVCVCVYMYFTSNDTILNNECAYAGAIKSR